MKAMMIVQVVAWSCSLLAAVAAEPSNTPVRITINQFSRPPEDRIIVTSSNGIARLARDFPGYEKQAVDGLSRGHWPVEYTVDIAFADGHSRTIYVADNRWTAGSENYTPLAENWDAVLLSMTSNFFKRTWANMERLEQVHEPTTLIIGPCEAGTAPAADSKRQPRGGRDAPPATRPSKPSPSP